MGLRELKRTSGAVVHHGDDGQWMVTAPGELVRCPGRECRTAIIRAPKAKIGLTRLVLAGQPVEDDSAVYVCKDGRCKREMEVQFHRAHPSVPG